jgi:hypothetical protein
MSAICFHPIIYGRNSGFQVALIHHLDMPLMGQSGINVSPGSEIQIAVSPTIIDITQDAINRFNPKERECYLSDEVVFDYLPQKSFRYQVIDPCLAIPALQSLPCNHCLAIPALQSLSYNP